MTDLNAADLLFTLGVALNSPDPSTQNGAVLRNSRNGQRFTITAAWNQFPEGVQYTDERWERPTKYSFIEHAERGAIYKAAKYGIPTMGQTMVCQWAACADCARAIVCAEIRTLVRLKYSDDEAGERWKASCELGDIILQEAGVQIIEVDEPIVCTPIRRDGRLWTPAGFIDGEG